jgi:hypothetical protein
MPKNQTITIHLVCRLGWDAILELCDNDYPESLDVLIDEEEHRARAEDAAPVQGFLSRDKAEEHCRLLERKEREEHYPFEWGGGGFLGEYCSLTPVQFRRHLSRELKVNPPTLDRRGMGDLPGWWEEVAEGLTAEQTHGVWDALDRIRFFTIVSKEVELVGAANPTTPPERLALVEKLRWQWRQYAPVGEVPPDREDEARRNPFKPAEFLLPTSYRRSGPGSFPVKAFLDSAAADDFARDQERLAWQSRNPFRYGEKVSEWTSLDAARLHDWLLDTGLDPPAVKAKPSTWVAWYDKVKPRLTEVQWVKLHEALDRVRFYRVVELTE